MSSEHQVIGGNTAVTDSRRRRAWNAHALWAIGVLLILSQVTLAACSPRFFYGGAPLKRPILLIVGIQIIAGILYLAGVLFARSVSPGRGTLAWALLVGITLRLSLLGSTPILEDDYHRYLWDGAALVNGINPFAFAPKTVLEAGGDSSTGIPPVLLRLSSESGIVLSRVNHPELRTIYPPVAQGAFALAHWTRPWSLVAWRVILLLFDSLTLLLVVVILRTLDLPVLWSIIYWWNPVLVKETFNSGHMDVVVLPFALGAVLLAIRRRHIWASGSLALAMGAKVWPAVLVPLALRPLLSSPKKLFAALSLFGVLCGLMLVPIYTSGLDGSSGFNAYGKFWEMNDALFMLFLWGFQALGKWLQLDSLNAQLITRVAVGALLCGWILWLARRNAANEVEFCDRCLLVVGAVFLLSPTQFPWYYVWLVPLLAISPRASLLSLTALLPLYYLRFYFSARDNVVVFDYGIVWLEFVPVWILLIREWYVGQRRPRTPPADMSD